MIKSLLRFGLTTASAVGPRLVRLQAFFGRKSEGRSEVVELLWLIPCLATHLLEEGCLRVSMYCQARLASRL